MRTMDLDSGIPSPPPSLHPDTEPARLTCVCVCARAYHQDWIPAATASRVLRANTLGV